MKQGRQNKFSAILALIVSLLAAGRAHPLPIHRVQPLPIHHTQPLPIHYAPSLPIHHTQPLPDLLPPEPAPRKEPTIRSLVSVPMTKTGFQHIFDTSPTKSTEYSVERNLWKFAQRDSEFLFSNQQLRKLLEVDTSNVLLLVGHNKDGEFMFSDGSSFPFADIDTYTTRNRVVVLVSCNSASFSSSSVVGINWKIDYDQASRIQSSILEKINSRSDLDFENNYNYSVGEITKIVEAAEIRAHVIKGTPYAVGGGATSGAVITYISVFPQD